MRKLLIIVLVLLLPAAAHAQRWSLGTNAASWGELGTANAQLHLSVAQHWSLNAGFLYNPWTFGQNRPEGQFQDRKRSCTAGVRWWPWNVYSGWWVGASGQYQEYNAGGLESPLTEEGDDYGAKLDAGYTLMLSKKWNVEFGLGLRAGFRTYTVFACPRCGRVIDEGEKTFFLPDTANLSIVYVF